MKEKYFNLIMPFIWFSLLVFCVFLFAFTSHAESYFPMQQNENSTIVDQVIAYAEINFDSENNNILIYGPYATTSSSKLYYFFYFAKDSGYAFAEINSNQYQISFYTTGQPTVYGGSMTYSSRTGNVSSSSLSNILGYFQNLNSSLYDSSKSYVSNFRVYTSNNIDTREVVLLYGSDEPTVNTGHATPPDPFESPTLATGSNYTLPREVPESPTIINYSWTTYNSPTIDNSTVESLLESLIDVVQYNLGYVTTNISNEFDNLLTNIKGYFDYVSKTIQYYCGLIISNIQNGIDTLYNNMVSLIEPIFEKVDYFTENVDVDEINTAFEDTAFYFVKTQFTSVFTTFDNAFDIAEPDSFTIIFNVQNITLFYDFGVRSPVTVDLGANFLPIRAALRTFLWVLVSFGSVFVVEHGLANWLRGERNT